MSAATEAACAAAMARIKKHINRCAGQHKRAVASAFALAGAPVVAEVEGEAQQRLPCCVSAGSVHKLEGQGGQGVGGAVELQVAAGGEAPGFTCEVVNHAIRSKDVADAINEAEFGLYLLCKPDHLAELAKAQDAIWGTSFVADHDAPLRSVPPSIDGVLFRDGQYFIVDRQRVVPLDSFSAHVDPLELIGKYLLKSFRASQGVVSEGTASAQRINRGRA